MAAIASADSTDTAPSDLSTEPLALTEGMLVARLAQALRFHYPLALDAFDQLFAWEKGTYLPITEAWIGEKMVDWLRGPGRPGESRLSIRIVREVFARLHYHTGRLAEIPPSDIISVENGLIKIDWKRGGWTLIPHSPSHLSTIQLPIRYDEGARCPEWDDFCQFLLGADLLPLVEEVYGACMTTFALGQEAIWLWGEGSNGKSVFIDVLRSILGFGNTAEISFSDMATDRFIGAEVYRKLLVYDYDSAPGKVENASLFKKITASDSIRAQAKYGQPFNFRPFAKVVFAGNFAPEARDTSEGFMRRVVIVPFMRDFRDPALEARRQSRLDVVSKITTPKEKSGILNRALAGLIRLKQKGKFSQPAAVLQATGEFKTEANPLKEFMESEFVIKDPNPDAYVVKKNLADAYIQWRRWKGMISLTQSSALDTIGKQIKWLRTSQKRLDNGNRAWVYSGVRLNYEALKELE